MKKKNEDKNDVGERLRYQVFESMLSAQALEAD